MFAQTSFRSASGDDAGQIGDDTELDGSTVINGSTPQFGARFTP